VLSAFIRPISGLYSDTTVPTKFGMRVFCTQHVNYGCSAEDTVHRKPATVHRNPFSTTPAMGGGIPCGRKEWRPDISDLTQ
jgi:hypothetical protein